MKKYLILLMIFMAINLQAISLLNTGFQARAAGMGNAFSALADDASALYYNPALLYDINEMQASIGYSHLFLTGNNINFSYVYPKLMRKPDLGVSIGYSTIIDNNDLISYSSVDHGNPGDYTAGHEFGYTENLFMFGSGVKIINIWLMQISGGASVKMYNRTIDSFESKGYGFDAGLNTKHKYFNFALVFKNLMAKLSHNAGETDTVPLTIRTGALIQIKRIIKDIFEPADDQPTYADSSAGITHEDFNYVINPVIDAEFVLDDEMEYRIFTGLEGWLNRVAALRFGYNNFQGLSMGGSVHIEIIRIDYSYTVHSELEGTHRFTGTYYF